MTIGSYLLTMTLATLVSWGAFLMTLYNVDPFDGGVTGRTLLLAALFLAVFGTLSLIGFLVRRLTRSGAPLYWHVLFSFRQALIFSALAVAALTLQALRLLTGWNIVLLVLGALLVEAYWWIRQPRRQGI